MSSDLNENMTSEEIKAYAESVMQEAEQDRQGETKSDAEIVVSTSPPIETHAEDNVSSEATEGDPVGEDSGDSSNDPEWVTDEVKAEVAAYGIEGPDLSDFTSREELDRALRLLDKTVLRSGKEALSTDEPTRNEKGQFVKKEQNASEPEGDEPDGDRYEVSISPDLYDEEIVNEFTKMRDHYESRLKGLEEKFAEVSGRSKDQEFDSLVDSLGHVDLFGKTGKESKQELARREELNIAVEAQVLGLQRMGLNAVINEKLVDRVANMVFADELARKRLKQKTSKIAKQSNLRMGGSPTKPVPPSSDPREEADRLYRELERK